MQTLLSTKVIEAGGRCEDSKTKEQNSDYRQVNSCFIYV